METSRIYGKIKLVVITPPALCAFATAQKVSQAAGSRKGKTGGGLP